jgi:hypothetical protein
MPLQHAPRLLVLMVVSGLFACGRGDDLDSLGVYVYPGSVPVASENASPRSERRTWEFSTDKSFEEVVDWYRRRYRSPGHNLRGVDLGSIAPEIPGTAGREQRVFFLTAPAKRGASINVIIRNPDVDRAEGSVAEVTRISIVRKLAAAGR